MVSLTLATNVFALSGSEMASVISEAPTLLLNVGAPGGWDRRAGVDNLSMEDQVPWLATTILKQPKHTY